MTTLFWSRFSKGFPLSTCNYRHKHLLWRKTIKKLKLICLLKSVDPGNNWQNEGMPKCLSPSVSCWSHNIKISQSIWGKIEVFLRWLLLNIHCSSFPVLIYFYLCNFFWGGWGGVGTMTCNTYPNPKGLTVSICQFQRKCIILMKGCKGLMWCHK